MKNMIVYNWNIENNVAKLAMICEKLNIKLGQGGPYGYIDQNGKAWVAPHMGAVTCTASAEQLQTIYNAMSYSNPGEKAACMAMAADTRVKSQYGI